MFVGLTIALLLLPATAACLYTFLLGALGLRRKKPPSGSPATASRIAVLIPAHDEKLSLPSTLDSVFQADPNAEVFVIADNCTDDTAEIAERLGAKVFARNDRTRIGKGYALEFGIARLSSFSFDAVFVLDADCRAEKNLFVGLSAILNEGAGAAQTRVVSNPSGAPASYVAAVGAQIDDTLARGKDRLGLSTALRGTGMLFTTGLLKRHPWHCCGLAEDAEYAAQLNRAGVRVHFIGTTAVHCEAPSELGDFLNQRKRWGAALAIRDSRSVFAPLKSKPLALAHLLLTTLIAPICWPSAITAIWLGAIWFCTHAVYGGAMARLPRPTGRELFASFGVVARLAWQAIFGSRKRPGIWLRSARSP